MSKIYKTARGRMVDIDKVKLANETTVAVGNMRVNARGDIIGAGNQIAATRNQVMDQVYAVEEAPYSPNDPSTFVAQQAVMEASKAQALHDLARNLVQPTTNLEPAAPAQPATPPARGTLAGSVAKPVQVTQGPTPAPAEVKKSNGPSRI
jgi:hypothetical protein